MYLNWDDLNTIHDLYRLLRDRYCTLGQHEAIAFECLDKPDGFVNLCRNSSDCYRDRKRRPDRKQLRDELIEPERWIEQVLREDGRFEDELVILCPMQIQRCFEIIGRPVLNFQYVEHHFPAFDQKGMDALLVTEDKLPAVCEIKSETDRNLFFAFVQGLTYATEISTRTQYDAVQLLAKRYGIELPERSAGPFVDLYLVAAGGVQASCEVTRELYGTKPQLRAVTRELVRVIFKEKPSLGDFVRRVVWLQPRLDKSRREMQLVERFAFGDGIIGGDEPPPEPPPRLYSGMRRPRAGVEDFEVLDDGWLDD
jgi:hypothetical protein